MERKPDQVLINMNKIACILVYSVFPGDLSRKIKKTKKWTKTWIMPENWKICETSKWHCYKLLEPLENNSVCVCVSVCVYVCVCVCLLRLNFVYQQGISFILVESKVLIV